MPDLRSPLTALLYAALLLGFTGCTTEPRTGNDNDSPSNDVDTTDANSTGTDDPDALTDDFSSNGSQDGDDADLSAGTSDDGGSSSIDPGAKVYAERNCAMCHGTDGSGGVAHSIRGVGVGGLDAILRDSASTHPGGTVLELSDQDLEDLAAFLGAIDATTNGQDAPPAPTHTVDALASGVLHAPGLAEPVNNCTACHGADLSGTATAPSCTSCHGALWENDPGPPSDHNQPKGVSGALHRAGFFEPLTNCAACHGANLSGSGSVPSCTSCHGALWDVGTGPPVDHTEPKGSSNALHRPGFLEPLTNCTACHGDNLQGSGSIPSCTSCHGDLWNDASSLHTDLLTSGSITGLHAPGRNDPQANCASCHATDLFGTDQAPACWACHGSIWDASPDYPPTHTKNKDGFRHDPGLKFPIGDCDACHGADLTGTPLIPSCFACHDDKWEDEDDD